MNSTHLNTQKIKTLLSLAQSNPHAFFKDILSSYKTTCTSNLVKIKSSFISKNNPKLKSAIHQIAANGSYNIHLSKRLSSYYNRDPQAFDSHNCLPQHLSNEYNNAKSELLSHLNSLQIKLHHH